MKTYTSSLPDELFKTLAEKAAEYGIPKNQLIERAVRVYIEHLDRAAYLKSFKRMKDDEDVIALAEEGMADYLQKLESEAG
ncbi:MAG TPA: ribbon-helix-helix protein, CopG family [Cryomorphaceae bacterium]|nr:ribbon-helix-helix protein, CopG family [Cryomorphaceae bacterium]